MDRGHFNERLEIRDKIFFLQKRHNFFLSENERGSIFPGMSLIFDFVIREKEKQSHSSKHVSVLEIE